MLTDDFLVTLEHDVTRVVMTLMNIEREIRVATPGLRVDLRRSWRAVFGVIRRTKR